MACQQCISDPKHTCPTDLQVDGTYLVPTTGGINGDAVDLAGVVAEAETNTRLQLDLENSRLVYTGEKAANGAASPDSISVQSLAGLINLQDLRNVTAGLTGQGDILIFDLATQSWVPYTIPSGDLVSTVGIDLDGNLVKGVGGGGGGGEEGVSVPIGGSVEFPTDDPAKIPSGFVIEDGREISRTVYSELFDLIGTTYGSGNGTTTFNIPSTVGRVTVGKAASGTFGTIGATPGAETVTLTVGQMPTHAHGVYDPGHAHGTAGAFWQDAGGSGTYNMTAGGNKYARGLVNVQVYAAGTGIGIYNNGGSEAHNNIQPSIVKVKIMRII